MRSFARIDPRIVMAHSNYQPGVLDIVGRRKVPRDFAALAAGRDAYLRKRQVNCQECGRPYRLCDSESAHLCETCYEIAGIENEIQDGLHGPEVSAAWSRGEQIVVNGYTLNQKYE